MHRRGEALFPALADEVLVRGAQEVGRGHGAEEPSERPGEEQRAGAGPGALAADVDEHDLEAVARGAQVRDDEVPGEAVAVCREDARAGRPPLGQVGHRAHGGDAVAQLGEHPVAAEPPGADERAGPRGDDHDPHDRDHRDPEEQRTDQVDSRPRDPGGDTEECDDVHVREPTRAQQQRGEHHDREEQGDRHFRRPADDGQRQGDGDREEDDEEGPLGPELDPPGRGQSARGAARLGAGFRPTERLVGHVTTSGRSAADTLVGARLPRQMFARVTGRRA